MTPREVQERLLELGYYLGPSGADGAFGEASRAALEAFQREYGLVVDGICGPVTMNVLLRGR